ncbi:MAG: SPASM domain-containing protein [Smithellaceae bacterium]
MSGCSALAMIATKFPELIIGDVFNGINQLSTNNLILLAQAGSDDRAACKGCQAASNCTGGCLAINYSTTGLATVPPKVYCRTISTIPEAWSYAWGDR